MSNISAAGLLGSSHPAKATAPAASTSPFMLSQHKRSLSFNHHLSYNQYAANGNSSGHPINSSSTSHSGGGQQQQPKSLGYINQSGSIDSHHVMSAASKPLTPLSAAKMGGGARNVKG